MTSTALISKGKDQLEHLFCEKNQEWKRNNAFHYSTEVFQAEFSEDGQHILLGCSDGTLRLVTNTPSFEEKGRITFGLQNPILQFYWHRQQGTHKDLVFLVMNSEDCFQAHILNGQITWKFTPQTATESSLPSSEQLSCCTASPDERFYAVGGKNRHIYMVEWEKKHLHSVLSGNEGLSASSIHKGRIMRLCFLSNDLLLSTDVNHMSVVWDWKKKVPLQTITGSSSFRPLTALLPPLSTSSSPLLVAASYHRSNHLQLWETTSLGCKEVGHIALTMEKDSNASIGALCCKGPLAIAADSVGRSLFVLVHPDFVQEDEKGRDRAVDWKEIVTRLDSNEEKRIIHSIDILYSDSLKRASSERKFTLEQILENHSILIGSNKGIEVYSLQVNSSPSPKTLSSSIKDLALIKKDVGNPMTVLRPSVMNQEIDRHEALRRKQFLQEMMAQSQDEQWEASP